MKFVKFAALLASVIVLSAQSAPNPVVEHYRAYRTALEAGDWTRAEAEAAAAYDASVERSGDGGSTVALAVNLAQTRLSLGKTAQAYEPALRAYNAVSASDEPTVDPLMAALILGRSELTDEHWRSGRDRLLRLFDDVGERNDLRGEAYLAAAELGRDLVLRGDNGRAITAWSFASDFADAAGGDQVYARAEARLGEGVARLVATWVARDDAQRRPTDTRLGFRAEDQLNAANRAFTEARILLQDAAHIAVEDGGVTVAQRKYADTLAWSTLLDAYIESWDLPVGNIVDVSDEFASAPSTRPANPCDVELVDDPEPNFPAGGRSRASVGAVVLRAALQSNGEYGPMHVVSAVPDAWFQPEVERVASQWRLEIDRTSSPSCEVEPISFVSYRFYFR